MSAGLGGKAGSFRLRLPATSANLGSGFDAAAVALDFFLDIEAQPAQEFSIVATGRDRERCSQIKDNLVIEIYSRLLTENGRCISPLAIRMNNDVPLGMGCGSSATGRLAAIAMAVHFGDLDWTDEQILEEACLLEGHPDNAAACWLGGFVAAASEGRAVHLVRITPPTEWRAIVVLPLESLSTSKARAVLPENYTRADVVENIQAASLLGLAFAKARGDLLRIAMRDRIHQPYRSSICPLLPHLLPLAGRDGILGAALSGAGPAVLVIVGRQEDLGSASTAIRNSLECMPEPQLHICRFETSGACQSFNDCRS
jgi:homoserine kinase